VVILVVICVEYGMQCKTTQEWNVELENEAAAAVRDSAGGKDTMSLPKPEPPPCSHSPGSLTRASVNQKRSRTWYVMDIQV